mmetsp:Transcript_44921/g.105811  ORF Transcript_44921/g.105811 Transcript_44921/m.105811 type:complete len:221 (+) Transcript_44921:989-1651(+)
MRGDLRRASLRSHQDSHAGRQRRNIETPGRRREVTAAKRGRSRALQRHRNSSPRQRAHPSCRVRSLRGVAEKHRRLQQRGLDGQGAASDASFHRWGDHWHRADSDGDGVRLCEGADAGADGESQQGKAGAVDCRAADALQELSGLRAQRGQASRRSHPLPRHGRNASTRSYLRPILRNVRGSEATLRVVERRVKQRLHAYRVGAGGRALRAHRVVADLSD